MPTLRDRKRARTRQAIIDAATELFDRDGYAATTVANIAERAEIGTRTFFSYFTSKEELLFPDSEARVQAALDAIASRKPGEGPDEVLLRALRTVGEDMVGLLASQRVELIRAVPAVRGRALQVQLDAQTRIAHELAMAYPGQLDEVSAAALTGAFIGAITGALLALLRDGGHDDPERTRDAMLKATRIALGPWHERLSTQP